MPPNINPYGSNSTRILDRDRKFSDKNLKRTYKPLYPDGLDLTPGSELHDRIVGEVIDRAQSSERAMSGRHATWDNIDKSLTAFIDLSTEEEYVKNKDSRKPVSIVIPESFATRETFLTYFISVFGDYPSCRIEGTGPEDHVGGILLEKVIDIQAQRSNLLLEEMYQWGSDISYGFGVLHTGWTVERGMRSQAEPIIDYDPNTGMPAIIGFSRQRVPTIKYEGMNPQAIDNRKYLPDPNVPIYKVQDGEYVGWVEQTTYNALLKAESSLDSELFNIQYLNKITNVRSSIYTPSDADAREAEGGEGFTTDNESHNGTFPVDIIWMYIDLIPADWKLGDSEIPEKYMFGVASDNIVIACHPLDLDHGQFPVCVCASNADGHCMTPTARMEILSGYQTFLNYLINTHMIETDKFLKNRLVVNPKWINVADIKKGKDIIMTRPSAWARDVKGTYEQLQQTDVTRNHLADASQIIQLSRQHGGSVDALLGVQRQSGERVTAAEYEGTRGSAVSRLQRLARIISMQSRLPMFRQFCANTQQFMSQEVYVSMVGESEETLRGIYGSTPNDKIGVQFFDISVDFDVLIQDGSVTGGESAQSWLEFYQILSQNPAVAAQFDMSRMGLNIARLLGNKNPEKFKRPINAQIVPDQQAQAMAEAGNIVPMQQGVA